MLPTLISHLRSSHSHEPGLCFSCGIDGCPKVFKNTNTYYKHVTKVHKDRYSQTSNMLKRSLLTKHHSTAEGESDEGEQSTTNKGNSDINGDVPAQHDGSRSTVEGL